MSFPYTLFIWSEYRTLTTPNVDKDVGQQKLSLITIGNKKWYIHF